MGRVWSLWLGPQKNNWNYTITLKTEHFITHKKAKCHLTLYVHSVTKLLLFSTFFSNNRLYLPGWLFFPDCQLCGTFSSLLKSVWLLNFDFFNSSNHSPVTPFNHNLFGLVFLTSLSLSEFILRTSLSRSNTPRTAFTSSWFRKLRSTERFDLDVHRVNIAEPCLGGEAAKSPGHGSPWMKVDNAFAPAAQTGTRPSRCHGHAQARASRTRPGLNLQRRTFHSLKKQPVDRKERQI